MSGYNISSNSELSEMLQTANDKGGCLTTTHDVVDAGVILDKMSVQFMNKRHNVDSGLIGHSVEPNNTKNRRLFLNNKMSVKNQDSGSNMSFGFNNVGGMFSAIAELDEDDRTKGRDDALPNDGGFTFDPDAPIPETEDIEAEGYVFQKVKKERYREASYVADQTDVGEIYAQWLRLSTRVDPVTLAGMVKRYKRTLTSVRQIAAQKDLLLAKIKRYTEQRQRNAHRGRSHYVPHVPKADVENPGRIRYHAPPLPVVAAMHPALGFSVKGQVAFDLKDFEHICANYRRYVSVSQAHGVLNWASVCGWVAEYFRAARDFLFQASSPLGDSVYMEIAYRDMVKISHILAPWVRKVQPTPMRGTADAFLKNWKFVGAVFEFNPTDYPSVGKPLTDDASARGNRFATSWSELASILRSEERATLQGGVGSKPSAPLPDELEVEPPREASSDVRSTVRVGGVTIPIVYSREDVARAIGTSVSSLSEAAEKSGVTAAGLFIKEILALLSFITLVARAPDNYSLAASWYLFLERYADKVFYPKFLAYVKRFVPGVAVAQTKNLPDLDVATALAKFKDSLGSETAFAKALTGVHFVSLMNSELFRTLWDMVSTISSFSLLAHLGIKDEAAILHIKARIERFLIKGETVDNFIGRFAGFFVKLCSTVKSCYEAGSLDPLFGNCDPEEFIKYADFLILDEQFRLDTGRPNGRLLWEKRVAKGEIPRGIVAQVTASQHLELVHGAIAEGNIIYSRLARNKEAAYGTVVKTKLEQLNRKAYLIPNTKLGGATRVQPFSLFVCGQPGVGKTNLATAFRKAIGRANDFPVGEDNVMFVQKATNFADTFFNQWLVVMDDIDQAVGPITQSIETHTDIVIRLINNRPLNMEKAAVDEKGAFFANFQASLYLSNYKNGKVAGYIAEPMAFWRRFNYHVEMVVKPEYANAAGGLDEDKVTANPTGDYWVMRVSKYQPTSNTSRDVLPFVHVEDMSMLAFLTRMAAESKVWLARQREMLLSQARQTYCDKCGVGENFHPGHPGEKTPCDGGSFVFELERVQMQHVSTGLAMGVIAGGLTYVYSRVAVNAVGVAASLTGPEALARFKEHEAKWLSKAQAGLTAVVAIGVAIGTAVYAYAHTYPIDFADSPTKLAENFLGKEKRNLDPKYLDCTDDNKATLEAEFALTDDKPDQKREGWANIKQFTPVIPPSLASQTTSVADLALRLRSVMARVECAETNMALWGLQIEGIYWVVPRHIFIPNINALSGVISDDARLTQPLNAVTVTMIRGEEKITTKLVLGKTFACVPNRDIVVMAVPELFPTSGWVKKHMTKTSQSGTYSMLDSARLVKPNGTIEASLCKYVYVGAGRLRVPSLAYGGITSIDGDCGLPLVVTAGSHTFIAGFHHIYRNYVNPDGTHVSNRGESEELVLNEISGVILEVAAGARLQGFSFLPHFDTTQLRPMFSDSDVKLTSLPRKSSVRVALDRHAPSTGVLGSITPPLLGATMGTKVVPTLFARDERVVRLVEQTTGRPDGFQPPRFAGRMHGSEWIDPYTVNISGWRNIPGDPEIWDKALDDYVNGMENLVGIGGVRPLTDYEAWRGVVADDINPTNLRTSTGPPLFRKKSAFVEFDDANATVRVHPLIMQHIARITEVVERNQVYVVACTSALKDEVVTAKKNDNHAIRVFNILPMAYNFLVRKYLAGFISFMTRYRDFSEILMGINISSDDISAFISAMGVKNEMLDRLFAGDYEKYDVRQATAGILFVFKVVSHYLDYTAYTEEEKRFARQILLGLLYRMVVIKNDILLMTYQNPSGGGFTTACNSVNNSGNFRYVYYRCAQDNNVDPPPFREVVTLGTGGDDHMGAVSAAAWWFDPSNFPKYFAEIGHTYTDAAKSGLPPRFMSINEVTFFKRSFRRVAYGWLAPIELKTLAKMLSYYVAGELTRLDHHAVLLSNVKREAFLHPPHVRDELISLCNSLAVKIGVADNAYYENLSVAEFEQMYLARKFWCFRSTSIESTDLKNNQNEW